MSVSLASAHQMSSESGTCMAKTSTVCFDVSRKNYGRSSSHIARYEEGKEGGGEERGEGEEREEREERQR